jgi:hypothetical protein
MMRSARQREVVAAMILVGREVEELPTGWRFRFESGDEASSVGARLEDGWLLLDAPLQRAPAEYGISPWRLVEANAWLPGGVKFALAPEDARIHVRADLPVGEANTLAARLSEVGRGYGVAEALARGVDPSEGDSPGRPHGAIAEPPPEGIEGGLSRLCEEAGWVFTERSSQRFAVDLEVGEAFCQALLESGADGSVTASVELEDSESKAEPCREALAIFLLRACGWLRMVRFTATSRRGRWAPRFEVAFATHPSADELSEALSVLSVAFRFGGSEVRVLARSEAAAQTYLACQSHLVPTTVEASLQRGGTSRRKTKKKRAGTSRATGVQRPAGAAREGLLA